LTTPLGSRAIPSLAGAVQSTGTTSVTIPTGTVAGNYYIIWKADDANVAGETDETNNTKCKAIAIRH